MHEEPQVPNYGPAGRGARLAAGMVLAIEPMVNFGRPAVRVLEDGWTAVTRDRSLSAHFEHTVAVTADGPLVLTARRDERFEEVLARSGVVTADRVETRWRKMTP
jgi:methionyl aminopeptidase